MTSVDHDPGHAEAVTDRLRAVYGAASDTDLARMIGRGSSTVANWRSRGSVPYAQCVTAARDLGVSLDWLLLGVGDARPTSGDGPRCEDASADYAARAGPESPTGPGSVSVGVPAELAGPVRWLVQWWAGATAAERTRLLLGLFDLPRGDG